MAVLPGPQRQEVFRILTHETEPGEEISILKNEMRTLVNLADDFLDTQFSTFNASLPARIRSRVEPRVKRRALRECSRRRHIHFGRT